MDGVLERIDEDEEQKTDHSADNDTQGNSAGLSEQEEVKEAA